MPEETEDNGAIQMGLSVTWRELGPAPTAVVQIPLGGPDPALIVTLDFDSDPQTCMIEMSVSGFPSEEATIELLRAIATHMETMPSTRITNDGVEYHDPTRKAEDT